MAFTEDENSDFIKLHTMLDNKSAVLLFAEVAKLDGFSEFWGQKGQRKLREQLAKEKFKQISINDDIDVYVIQAIEGKQKVNAISFQNPDSFLEQITYKAGGGYDGRGLQVESLNPVKNTTDPRLNEYIHPTAGEGQGTTSRGRDRNNSLVRVAKEHLNVILEGPPGTGKTHAVKGIVDGLHADPEVEIDDKTAGRGDWAITMHPATSYEDFIEGIRPISDPDNENSTLFRYKPGVFTRLVKKAIQSPNVTHVVLLDELNRCNVPMVLGDLLTTLERGKRTLPAMNVEHEPSTSIPLQKDMDVIIALGQRKDPSSNTGFFQFTAEFLEEQLGFKKSGKFNVRLEGVGEVECHYVGRNKLITIESEDTIKHDQVDTRTSGPGLYGVTLSDDCILDGGAIGLLHVGDFNVLLSQNELEALLNHVEVQRLKQFELTDKQLQQLIEQLPDSLDAKAIFERIKAGDDLNDVFPAFPDMNPFSHYYDKDNIKDLKNKTNAELADELEELGLKKAGNKADKIARLTEPVPNQSANALVKILHDSGLWKHLFPKDFQKAAARAGITDITKWCKYLLSRSLYSLSGDSSMEIKVTIAGRECTLTLEENNKTLRSETVTFTLQAKLSYISSLESCKCTDIKDYYWCNKCDAQWNRSNRTELTLPGSAKRFHIPNNLIVIGTMNTTDRSVAPLDAALRRRFVFQRLEPKAPSEYALKLDALPVEDKEKFQAAINRWEAVNKALRDSLGGDSMIGHSYLYDARERYKPDKNDLDVVLHDMWTLQILPQIADMIDATGIQASEFSELNEAIEPYKWSKNSHLKSRVFSRTTLSEKQKESSIEKEVGSVIDDPAD